MILYLDTCVLLDMFRDPTRERIGILEHESAKRLLESVRTSEVIEVCIAEQVEREFFQNLDAVKTEAKNNLESLIRRVKRLNRLIILYGSSGEVNLNHWERHVERCLDVAKQWMQEGDKVYESDNIYVRAAKRVIDIRTPVRKGKEEMTDCIILETYLEHLNVLRSSGRKARAVFVSSNTKDYTDKATRRVRSDIAEEFEALGLHYAPNMGAARGMLGV